MRGQRLDNRSRKGTEDPEEADYFAKFNANLDSHGFGSTACFAQVVTFPIEETPFQESLADKAPLQTSQVEETPLQAMVKSESTVCLA